MSSKAIDAVSYLSANEHQCLCLVPFFLQKMLWNWCDYLSYSCDKTRQFNISGPFTCQNYIAVGYLFYLHK